MRRLLVLLAFAVLAAPAAAGVAPSGPSILGKTIADDGFRPGSDGFAFENYGSDKSYDNLTPVEMVQLFGNAVCASGKGASCSLTPTADQWMQANNQSMGGGHCYGFSALSLIFYGGQGDPKEFGSTPTFSLGIDSNPALQRAIAYTWVMQVLDSVRSKQIGGTPNDVLDALISALQHKSGEKYTIGIFKRDGSGGHAITPYAVKDQGGGKFVVLVYDNNYPNETRTMAFDRDADTWSYNAAINPSVAPELYEGDAGTKSIQLYPTTPGLGVQPCPFCSGGSRSPAARKSSYDSVYLTSKNPYRHGRLLIADRRGRRIGYVGARRFVSNLPGAQAIRTLAFKDYRVDPEPVYHVPSGQPLTISLDASTLRRSDDETFSMIGRTGNYVGVSDHRLSPGQKDTIRVAADETSFRFTTGPKQRQSPDLALGFEDAKGPDYGFGVKARLVAQRATVTLQNDRAHGKFSFDTTGSKGKADYAIAMIRTDAKGDHFWGHPLVLRAGERATLDYRHWQGHGKPMTIFVTYKGHTRKLVVPDIS